MYLCELCCLSEDMRLLELYHNRIFELKSETEEQQIDGMVFVMQSGSPTRKSFWSGEWRVETEQKNNDFHSFENSWAWWNEKLYGHGSELVPLDMSRLYNCIFMM